MKNLSKIEAMKKIFLFAIVFLLFLSCGSDKIWDFINYDVCFIVKNADGENLLDPATEGHILDSDITVEYNGKTYALNDNTRADKAVWYGLRIEAYGYKDNTPTLKFGEFDTAVGYREEQFTVHWGDGSSDVVKFDLYVKGTSNNPKVKKKIWLNGKLKSESSFVILIIK